MAKFEKVKRFEDKDIQLPKRGTAASAGYDFYVAEDIVIPSLYANNERFFHFQIGYALDFQTMKETLNLSDAEKFYKELGFRPTLVPTGVKCKLDEGTYLELSVRSSTPLKYLLILANGVGIIDADYYGNPSNDGEIFFQMINLGPNPIQLHKGDKIGQGIIKPYLTVEDDAAEGERLGGFGSTSV